MEKEPIMTDDRWERLKVKLANSKFRSRFVLKDDDLDYITQKGLDVIEKHTRDFVSQRLAPAEIPNDGKQTPYRGHPTFIAQHATATCCRKCLAKWHDIAKGHQLTDDEISYVTSVIMRWIRVSPSP